jgi:hypothetical protein
MYEILKKLKKDPWELLDKERIGLVKEHTEKLVPSSKPGMITPPLVASPQQASTHSVLDFRIVEPVVMSYFGVPDPPIGAFAGMDQVSTSA